MGALRKYRNYLLIIFNILALIVLFFNCGSYTINGKTDYYFTGFEIIFGYKLTDIYDQVHTLLKFNSIGLMVLILLLISFAIPFLKKYLQDKTLKVFGIINVILAIGFFCLPMTAIHYTKSVYEYFHGELMVYVGGVSLALSALLSFYLVKKDKEEKTEEKEA